jgi:hypothetical protein
VSCVGGPSGVAVDPGYLEPHLWHRRLDRFRSGSSVPQTGPSRFCGEPNRVCHCRVASNRRRPAPGRSDSHPGSSARQPCGACSSVPTPETLARIQCGVPLRRQSSWTDSTLASRRPSTSSSERPSRRSSGVRGHRSTTSPAAARISDLGRPATRARSASSNKWSA